MLRQLHLVARPEAGDRNDTHVYQGASVPRKPIAGHPFRLEFHVSGTNLTSFAGERDLILIWNPESRGAEIARGLSSFRAYRFGLRRLGS
jgi:hypothetical protein